VGASELSALEHLELWLGGSEYGGDCAAAALLAGRPLTHLKKLDLHYNFLSEPFRQRIRQALEPAGVEVDLDQDDADWDEERDICVGPVFLAYPGDVALRPQD
jgi:hypothetical protein